jgi:hypothetical protein
VIGGSLVVASSPRRSASSALGSLSSSRKVFAAYTLAMRLTDFFVENYQSFVGRTTIELRPLALLFGYNSAGKSAALRVLPLAAHRSFPLGSSSRS